MCSYWTDVCEHGRHYIPQKSRGFSGIFSHTYSWLYSQTLAHYEQQHPCSILEFWAHGVHKRGLARVACMREEMGFSGVVAASGATVESHLGHSS